MKNTPGSLQEVLLAVEDDHDFLVKGEVFTEDLKLLGVSISERRKSTR